MHLAEAHGLFPYLHNTNSSPIRNGVSLKHPPPPGPENHFSSPFLTFEFKRSSAQFSLTHQTPNQLTQSFTFFIFFSTNQLPTNNLKPKKPGTVKTRYLPDSNHLPVLTYTILRTHDITRSRARMIIHRMTLRVTVGVNTPKVNSRQHHRSPRFPSSVTNPIILPDLAPDSFRTQLLTVKNHIDRLRA